MSIPTPEEQSEIIKAIEKNPFIIGEKICPISSAWFQKWKQYVNYDNDIEPIPTPIDPINNSDIITDGRLNQNLLENIDFNLLHKESYDNLQTWFSGGPTIELEVIPNSKGQPSVVTRFIPLKIIYKNQEKDFEAHRYMKISEIHKSARELFEIPSTVTTRLLDYFELRIGKEFNDDKYLEDYLVISGNPVYLDYQENDDSKSWYSNFLKKNSMLRSSSSFIYSNESCPGIVGFNNLGNTCYFNSGIQCLIHTFPLISKFIVNDEWRSDINMTNKIGMKGELASSFATLVNNVWSGKFSTISPLNLKNVMGRLSDTFSGFNQQDSHELIYAMLDGIHEDLNRCREKPIVEPVEGDGTDDEVKSIEAWKRYKLINDSIIVDIFDGLFCSRTLCPNCKAVTVVFDPFRSIPIPIEKPHVKIINLTYVPFSFTEGRKAFSIEIPSYDSIDFNRFASEEISRKIRKTVMVKLGAQLYNKNNPFLWSFKSICVQTATVYAFEILSENSIYATCKFQFKPREQTASVANLIDKFETPFLVDVTDLPDNFDKDDEKRLFEKKIEDRLNMLWIEIKDKNEQARSQKINQIFNKKVDLTPPDTVTFSEPSQKLASTFKTYRLNENVKQPSKTSNNFIDALVFIHLNEQSNFSMAPLFRIYPMSTEKKKAESEIISLSQCFDFFSMPEVLDEKNQWFCPKCKQFVCAEKKVSIWKLPQILIIQLKRFYGAGLATTKNGQFVDFPEILDMKNYVVGPEKNQDKIEYRLYAVSNQYGSLSFGHYTANARVRDPREPDDVNDKGWYNFNDSNVTKSSESDAHSAAAYILFYERIQK